MTKLKILNNLRVDFGTLSYSPKIVNVYNFKKFYIVFSFKNKIFDYRFEKFVNFIEIEFPNQNALDFYIDSLDNFTNSDLIIYENSQQFLMLKIFGNLRVNFNEISYFPKIVNDYYKSSYFVVIVINYPVINPKTYEFSNIFEIEFLTREDLQSYIDGLDNLTNKDFANF